MIDADLAERAGAWMADDPDPITRHEVQILMDAGDEHALQERFGERLQFGTAGIRGPVGAGPSRMNRALVCRVAAGLAEHLRSTGATGPVVVGRDARHRSDDFANDVAEVLAGASFTTFVLPGPSPTPVLAFAVRHLHCSAGVMVTASHNPPADNGVKVYGSDGAQIVPPTDALISSAIDAVGKVTALARGAPVVLGTEVLDAYLDAASAISPGTRGIRLVHTALHGVATAPLLALMERAGFPAPLQVEAQAQPDPDFPTVSFPNPEEPGALDLALALARRSGADAVIANDPDADRLAVAVPEGGNWRVLTGDELGVLLGDHVLSTTSGSDRLVATTVVSSPMLGKMAAEHGVHFARTLTGFKWIIRAAAERPGTRFVYGYEEALGYLVGDLVRDKDGLTAALAFAVLAAQLKADGQTVPARLDALARRYGRHATRQWSLRMEGAAGQVLITTSVARLVNDPPAELAGRQVESVEQPAPDVIVLWLSGGARVVVRPSGTEPKLKCYLLAVLPGSAPVSEAEPLLDDLQSALEQYLSPTP